LIKFCSWLLGKNCKFLDDVHRRDAATTSGTYGNTRK